MTEKNKSVNLINTLDPMDMGGGIDWNKVNTKIYPIII